ncbi:FtsX-like permease family protein [Actinacidiphila rubida]|uniref:FtsX-like permease family protein n=1 Tax=Actinacidiphila rubida TaxID=310780 RepID=UPI0015A6CC95|nr:FtsX-like permease family protein [Actinacidiphila rubida]
MFAVVAVLTAVIVAGPPVLDRMAGDALAARAADAQAARTLVRQSAVLHRLDERAQADPARSTLAPELAAAGRQFLRTAKAPLSGALRHQSTRVEVAPAGTSTAAGPGQLALLYADDAPARAAYVQGGPPGRAGRDGPIDVAVSVRTRDALHLALGQILDLEPVSDHYRTPARVSGFFALPPDAEAPLWRQEPLLERPSGGAGGWRAQAVVDASALDALQLRGAGDLTVTWQSVLRPDGAAATRMATPGGLVALSRAAEAYAVSSGDRYCPPDEGGYTIVACSVAGHGTETLDTADDIPLLVQDFGAEREQARTLESFALAGLLAVGLATVVVTARLALHRRAAAQALQRARGASAADLALLRLLQTAPAALLGLLAGLVAAGLLAPPGTSPGSALPAVALAAVAWLVLPALTWVALRDRGRREHPPRGTRRLTIEAGVLALAVAGVLALRSRGSAGSASGIDLQLAAVPAVLGLAAVVLLVRAYPLPLRLLARAARRGRGAVGTIGLSRAAGEAPRHALALLVLVTTLSTAVFGGLVSRTVADGRRAAAVWTAGADATVVGAGRDGTAEADLLHVPGVRRAVVLRGTTSRLVSGRDGTSWGRVRIAGVDAAGLHAAAPGSVLARALLAAGPARASTGADGRIVLPALASAEFGTAAVGDVYASALHNSHVSFRIVGVLGDAVREDPALGPLTATDAARTAGPGGDPTAAAPLPMLMLDAAAAAVLTRHDTDYSQVLLYGPRLDAAALHVAAARVTGPTGELVLRDEELAAAGHDGLLSGVRRVYAAGTALSVLLALLALVLELLTTARERGRTASRLRTLGLPTRSLAALEALELLPMALAAVAGGVAVGLATPTVLGPALTLRRFTGGPQAPPLHTDYLLTAALGAGLAALVVATVAAETWLGRRRGLGAVLRLGDPA